MPRTGRKENLKPVKSVEEAREKGAKGGKKSGEVRRQNKSLRQALRFDKKIIGYNNKTPNRS